jgi:hypothetical protein
VVPRQAVAAFSAGELQPRNPQSIAHLKSLSTVAVFLNHSDDLMPGNEKRPMLRELAFHNVQIRPADATRLHLDQRDNLTVAINGVEA